MTVTTQTRHVQENVGHSVVGYDEAVALGRVEPFDDASKLDDARRLIVGLDTSAAVDAEPPPDPLDAIATDVITSQRRRSIVAPLASAIPSFE